MSTFAVTMSNGALTNGNYPLVNYNNISLGSVANLNTNLPNDTRQIFTVKDNTSAKNIYLEVGGTTAATLIWQGDGVSNTWNVATPSNQVWLNGALPDAFYSKDNVTFNDSGSNSPVVSIDAIVAPSSITVSNNAKNYTFAGFSKITGSTGLSKTGTGTLTIANSGVNDYTGTTTINGGVLQLGDGVLNGNAGTGPIVDNAALVFNRPDDAMIISSIISGTGTVEQKAGGNSYGIVTLSGTNTYSGITTISAGTIKAGSTAALGAGNATTADPLTGTIIANGATLDVNNQTLVTEAVTVSGGSANGNGAIVNNNQTVSTTPQNALRFVTMTGDTTFGGSSAGLANSGRWDIRGTGAYLATGGNAYNITKVGNNHVSLVGVTVDAALADININQGIFDIQTTSTLGDPTKTVTIASGACLQFYNLSVPLNKKIVVNGGEIYAQNNNLATDNTILGTVAIGDSGGVLNAGGVRTDITTGNANTTMTINGVISGSVGPLTKTGPGTVILATANTYNGATTVNEGVLAVNGSLAGGITMATSISTVRTTLAGTGTVSGGVTDAYNTIIAPGATAAGGVVGTLTFGSNLSLNGGGQLNFDLTNDPAGVGVNDLINVTGNLSVTTSSGLTTVAVTPMARSCDGCIPLG